MIFLDRFQLVLQLDNVLSDAETKHNKQVYLSDAMLSSLNWHSTKVQLNFAKSMTCVDA